MQVVVCKGGFVGRVGVVQSIDYTLGEVEVKTPYIYTFSADLLQPTSIQYYIHYINGVPSKYLQLVELG